MNKIKKIENLNRIETMARKQAFVTLKDHKPNFDNNPICRLINPAKSDLGFINQQILERICSSVRNHNQAN